MRSRDRPGSHPEHVIDIVNDAGTTGVRVIASRERQPFGDFLHVSFSLHHAPAEDDTMQKETMALISSICMDRCGKPVQEILTEGVVSHWFFAVPAWVRERVGLNEVKP